MMRGTTRRVMHMSTHKFEVGDKVRFAPAFHQKAKRATDFEIVRRLPDLEGEFFYRIKSLEEPHERVAGESQLSAPPLIVAPRPAVARPKAKPLQKASRARG